MATLKELYTAIKADGAPVPDTFEEFDKYMRSGPRGGYDHRREVYDALKADGAPLPDTYEEFSKALFAFAPKTASPAKQPTSPGGSAQSGTAVQAGANVQTAKAQTASSFKLRRGGMDFTVPVEEVKAAGGLWGWAKAHPGAPVRVYMQGKKDDGTDFSGHVDLSQAYSRRKEKGYEYTTVQEKRWNPTEREKIRMSQDLFMSQQRHGAHMESIREKQRDTKEYVKGIGRMGEVRPVKAVRMNPETFKMEETWLTPDGNRTQSNALADIESFNYRMATDMSVGGQIRHANERLADIEKRLEARGKKLMKQHEQNEPGGILGLIMEAGQVVGGDKTGGATAQNPEDYVELANDKEYQALRLARRKAIEEIQKLHNVKEQQEHGERFWHDFGRATVQAVLNPDAWDFGKAELRDAATMLQLDGAIKSGEKLTQAENDALTELYLHNNVINRYQNLGTGDRWGNIAGTSLSFMKDFMLTGGFSGVSTKLPEKVAKHVAFNVAKRMGAGLAGEKIALDVAQRGVMNYIRQGGKGAIKGLLASMGKAGLAQTMVVKAIGVGAEDLLIRAPLMTFGIQGQSTTAKIIETKLGPVVVDEKSGELRFTDEKTWGTAAWQEGADQVIENYSEMWGAHIPAMSDVSKFFGARRLTAAVLRATRENAGTILSKTNKFLTRAGVNGYFGEVGEEYVGQLWRTMLNLDSSKDEWGNNLLRSGRFHGDIWGGMALSIGMTSAGTVAGAYGTQGVQKGVSGAIYLRHKKNMQKASRRASSLFEGDEWENLRQLIDSQKNDEMSAFAEGLIADPSMTLPQKEAVMDYVEKAMVYRGYNLGEILRGRAGETGTDDQELSQSYIDGYEAVSSQEMTDAYNMYQHQYEKLTEALNGMDDEGVARILDEINDNPIEALSNAGEELRPMMLDYVNALMVYEGMQQRAEDDVESRIAQAESGIDANTHRQTGNVQPATLKLNDRRVYIIDGNIAILGDGSIDRINSDNTIIVKDTTTGHLEFVSPNDVLSTGEAQDPGMLKASQAEAIRKEAEQRYNDNVSGKLSFEPGTTVTVPKADSTGQMVTATIVGPATDEHGNPMAGVVEIQYENGRKAECSMEALQHWVDQANRQKVNDFEVERLRVNEATTSPVGSAQPGQADESNGSAQSGNSADASPQSQTSGMEGATQEPRSAFERGYTAMKEEAAGLSDEMLERSLKHIESQEASLTEWGKGMAAAYRDEWKRRHGGDVSSPDGVTSPGSSAQYGAGIIKLRNEDGSETRGMLTGERDSEGRYEYYVEGDLQHLHYATKEELDNMLTDYEPEESQTSIIPDSTGIPQNTTGNEVSNVGKASDSPVSVGNGQETSPDGSAQSWTGTALPSPGVSPQSALQRIPRDAKGEPIFEQAEDPEHGWDALVEFADGDAATAKEIADTMAEEKRKAYEKAQKQKPKGKTPTEILASKKAISAELVQAEQEYNLWQQMAGVEQRRQDAIRSQQEAEARQRAAERAEAEKAEREAREEAARLEREALEGIPEWHLDTPENARKRGVRRFSGQMFTRQEPVQGVVGKEVEVKFSQKDLPKGHLAVIEAPQLQPSHIQGQRNPMFFIEEAQPKNRAEAVSMFAAKEMAEGIRPQEITGSATAYTGAPTINSRGEVIQGNNRSDALRYLWENKLPEQQQTYKQYLIDNAEQFGIDPEAVNAMQQPVLVNMLDVDDAEAIRLGQMTAQDTESGGVERIKPKNVTQRLGDDMRSFANLLLQSGDEEASFGQLVDRNGTEVLKWMAHKGAITNTQYQSAFDSKGNLTAEAKNDLQKVLYQAVFKGGSQQLEEMFDALPAKAQRAILSTAFRDMDSPVAGKMLPEIQASIAAYHQLMHDPAFAAAGKMEEALRAVEGFKRLILLDDRFEQYMPADDFR